MTASTPAERVLKILTTDALYADLRAVLEQRLALLAACNAAIPFIEGNCCGEDTEPDRITAQMKAAIAAAKRP